MEWLGFGPTDPADDSFVVTMYNVKVCAPYAEVHVLQKRDQHSGSFGVIF